MTLDKFKQFCTEQTGEADPHGVFYHAYYNCHNIPVEFDTENTIDDPEWDKSLTGVLGWQVSKSGIPFLGILAGGDWEIPVVSIVYRASDSLYIYVPCEGNIYDEGDGMAYESDEAPPEILELDYDAAALLEDIDEFLLSAQPAQHDDESILISKSKYSELLARDEFLAALEQAGIKEWVRYDYAVKLHEEYKGQVE